MRLNDLYPNFSNMPVTSQEAYVIAYRERRMREMEEYEAEQAAKKVRSSRRAPPLTADEEKLIALLGITKTQYRALKAAQQEE